MVTSLSQMSPVFLLLKVGSEVDPESEFGLVSLGEYLTGRLRLNLRLGLKFSRGLLQAGCNIPTYVESSRNRSGIRTRKKI